MTIGKKGAKLAEMQLLKIDEQLRSNFLILQYSLPQDYLSNEP